MNLRDRSEVMNTTIGHLKWKEKEVNESYLRWLKRLIMKSKGKAWKRDEALEHMKPLDQEFMNDLWMITSDENKSKEITLTNQSSTIWNNHQKRISIEKPSLNRKSQNEAKS